MHKKNKKIQNKLTNIIIILLYLFVGILSFPSDGKEFNQLYYFTIGIFFIIIILVVYNKDLKEDIKKFKESFIKNILHVILIAFLSFVIVTLGNFLKDMIFGWIQMSSYELVYPNIAKYPFYVLFVMVIYTPLVEGIIFNKSIFNVIENKPLFIIITSLVYGVMQVGLGFSTIGAVVSIIPYTLFMMLMSFTYVKKNNIFFPIFIWFLYSGFQFFVQSTAVLGW